MGEIKAFRGSRGVYKRNQEPGGQPQPQGGARRAQGGHGAEWEGEWGEGRGMRKKGRGRGRGRGECERIGTCRRWTCVCARVCVKWALAWERGAAGHPRSTRGDVLCGKERGRSGTETCFWGSVGVCRRTVFGGKCSFGGKVRTALPEGFHSRKSS